MFGLHAGVNGILDDLFHQLFVGELVKLRAHNGLFGVADDAQLFADGHGGVFVVAGDHHRADAGLAALFNGVLDLRTHRVDHAGQAHEGQLLLQRGGVVAFGFFFILAKRNGKHAQRAVGHRLVRPQNILADVVGHRHGLAGNDGLGALLEVLVRRALGILDEAFLRLVDGGHHFTAGIERRFADTRLLFVQRLLRQTESVGEVDQRRFRRFADGVVVFVELRVAALRHGCGDQLFVVAVVVDDGHFVLGQGAGFIRADDLRTAERFHGRQLADQCLPFTHGRDADRKNNGNDGGQTLGDRRHGKRDRGDEGRQRDFAEQYHGERFGRGEQFFNNTDHKDEDADADDELGQEAGKLAHLLLQRGLFVFRFAQRVGDLAHFGIHTGRDDDGAAAAVNDGGTGIHHIFAVAERHVFLPLLEIQRFDQLCDGDAFTGQRGFLELHGMTFEDPAVGGHGVAGLQYDDVADHEVFALDRDDLAVAQHVRRGGGHLHERFHRGLGLAFLNETHDGVDDDNGENDEDVGEFRKLKLAARLYHGDHGLNGGGNKKHNNHGVGERFDCLLEQAVLFGFLELVLAVFFQPFLRLGGRKTGFAAVYGGKNLVGFCQIILHKHIPSFLCIGGFYKTDP